MSPIQTPNSPSPGSSATPTTLTTPTGPSQTPTPTTPSNSTGTSTSPSTPTTPTNSTGSSTSPSTPTTPSNSTGTSITPPNQPDSSATTYGSLSSTIKKIDQNKMLLVGVSTFGLYCSIFKYYKFDQFYKTICKQAQMAGPKRHLKTQLYFYQGKNKINPLRTLLDLHRYTKTGSEHICQVLYGHPGTGKTVSAQDLIYQESLVRPAFYFAFKNKKLDFLKQIQSFLEFRPNAQRELKAYYRRLLYLPSFCLFTPVVFQLLCDFSDPFIYPAIAISIAASAGLRHYLRTKAQPLHRMVRDQFTPLVILDDVNIPIKANRFQYLDGQFFDLADVKYFSSQQRVAVNYFQNQTCFKHVAHYIKFNHSAYRDKFTIEQVNKMLQTTKESQQLKHVVYEVKDEKELKELNEILADSDYFVRNVLTTLIKLASSSQKIKQAAILQKIEQAANIPEPVFKLRQALINQYSKKLTNIKVSNKELALEYKKIEIKKLKMTALLQLLVQLFKKKQGGPIPYNNEFQNQPGVLCSVLIQLNVITATHNWLALVNKLAFQGMKEAEAELSKKIKQQKLSSEQLQMLNEFKRKCSFNFDLDPKPEGQ